MRSGEGMVEVSALKSPRPLPMPTHSEICVDNIGKDASVLDKVGWGGNGCFRRKDDSGFCSTSVCD